MEYLNVYVFGMDFLLWLVVERIILIMFWYIEENLKGYIMKGYMKVGVNIFLNLVSLMIGKICFFKELLLYVDYLDLYFFLWKNFSNFGYVIMFVEDLLDMGIFLYWKGFKE